MSEQLLTTEEATRILIKDVDPGVLGDAVHTALFDPYQVLMRTKAPTLDFVSACVSRNTPEFIDPIKFQAELARLNNRRIWTALYNNSPLVTKSIGARQDTEDPASPLIKINSIQYVDYITGSNDNFFVPYTLAMAAAVYGVEVADDFQNFSTRLEPNRKLLQAASSFAEAFFTKPESIEDVIARLQIVFPDPNKPKIMPSAFDALGREGSFRQKIMFATTGEIKEGRCPAPSITDKIYQEYGKHLQTPEYQLLFKARVGR